MAYYLIDFENVKSRGMEGVELLAEEDTVCIFYSDNADSMTFDLHRKLNETKAQIIYHKVAVGTKNALDFQLADRKSTRLNSSHRCTSRMPSSA